MTIKELSERTGLSGPRLTTLAKEGVMSAVKKQIATPPFQHFYDFDETAIDICEIMK